MLIDIDMTYQIQLIERGKLHHLHVQTRALSAGGEEITCELGVNYVFVSILVFFSSRLNMFKIRVNLKEVLRNWRTSPQPDKAYASIDMCD